MPIKSGIIIRDPQIQGGTPCFAGTRVPVKSLFDYISRGRTVAYFLEQFPSVRSEQVADVLAAASDAILIAQTTSDAA